MDPVAVAELIAVPLLAAGVLAVRYHREQRRRHRALLETVVRLAVRLEQIERELGQPTEAA